MSTKSPRGSDQEKWPVNAPTELQGQRVTLRPAMEQDRRSIYEWMAHSDLTPQMIGPPTYPDHPIDPWEEFCADYKPHFFDDSAPLLGRCFIISVNGEAVGQVNYNDIQEKKGVRRTELDIWLRSAADSGHGYGPDALDTLCRYLGQQFGVTEFMVQPSARNPRAIRAYEKIGFVKLDLPLEAARAEWGPSDYDDSVYMVKRIETKGENE